MGNYRKLWFTLIGVLIVTFSLLGYYGAEVYRTAPPIPAKIATAGGEVLFTHDSILDGQTAWQSVGGMQLGSIWGHGAYQAPDWTADWICAGIFLVVAIVTPLFCHCFSHAGKGATTVFPA